jgi:hypothetical protein
MLSFVVAGIACGFAALCYAELAAMIPVSGSAYTYSYATLGEIIAWIISWDLSLASYLRKLRKPPQGLNIAARSFCRNQPQLLARTPARKRPLRQATIRPVSAQSHLFLGTHADNLADAARKGRMKGGGAPPKLSKEAVVKIRASPLSVRKLADRLRCHLPGNFPRQTWQTHRDPDYRLTPSMRPGEGVVAFLKRTLPVANFAPKP